MEAALAAGHSDSDSICRQIFLWLDLPDGKREPFSQLSWREIVASCGVDVEALSELACGEVLHSDRRHCGCFARQQSAGMVRSVKPSGAVSERAPAAGGS